MAPMRPIIAMLASWAGGKTPFGRIGPAGICVLGQGEILVVELRIIDGVEGLKPCAGHAHQQAVWEWVVADGIPQNRRKGTGMKAAFLGVDSIGF